MTIEEYLATPETVKPMELAYGVLRVADSPTPVHQRDVAALFVGLHEHVRDRACGEVMLSPLDVILDAPRALVVQPDLFFISNERSAIVKDRVRGAPDLVVEVLSPFPRIGQLHERLDWFASYDVRECWLVHQIERWIDVLQFADRRIVSRRRFTTREPIASTVLPAFNRSLQSMLGY